jgi:RNA polymerase sigma-70 factor (ECF subfamily)
MIEQAYQQPADDDQLLAQARRKERGAVALLIRKHNRKLYRLARGILNDDSEAEDALQEAYVRAFNNLDAFRGEAQFGTWLARIVINEALAAIRRRRPTVGIDAIVEGPAQAQIIPFPYAHAEPDPEAATAQHQIRVLLERAIDSLPETFRGVLIARLVEGMSVEETAELFEIAPETVKTRVHRARHLLRREMERRIGPVFGDAYPFAGRRCEQLAARVLARLELA